MKDIIAPYTQGFLATVIGLTWLEFFVNVGVTVALGLIGGFVGILGRFLGKLFVEWLKKKFDIKDRE